MEKRMYFLVPYNISPIQQAIQAGHAALEYAHKYKDDPEYIDFIENWKTWIILNGGTTNSNRELGTGISVGTLNQALDNIIEQDNIKFSIFNEPDLNDALTAVCLVVDERVFNREEYPDFSDWSRNNPDIEYYNWGYEESLTAYRDEFPMITEEIMFLKELLNTKRLA